MTHRLFHSAHPIQTAGVLVAGSFVLLVLYRVFASFPVWFDEVFAKAIIFGAPVWIFAYRYRKTADFFGFSPRTFWPALLTGISVGGTLSFVGMIFSTFEKRMIFIPGLLASDAFWIEFALALVTAWWESLFFFGFVQRVLAQKITDEWTLCLWSALIFMAFHAPVLILRSGLANAFSLSLLLGFFAFGQAILFLRTKNVASVILSHAIWGMVLLTYR